MEVSFHVISLLQGKHLQRHVFVDNPRRLAVMDPDSEERWMVAVTLPDMKAVILLQIKSDSITQMVGKTASCQILNISGSHQWCAGSHILLSIHQKKN